MKLYKINNDIIKKIIAKGIPKDIGSKRFSVILKMENFEYPIKVVYIKEEDETIILTCYPLKRSCRDES